MVTEWRRGTKGGRLGGRLGGKREWGWINGGNMRDGTGTKRKLVVFEDRMEW